MRQRRQRRSAVGRVFASLVLLLLLAVGLAAAGGFYVYTVFTAPGPLQADKIYVVEQGQSQQEIGAALEREGIIANGIVFAGAAHLNALRGQTLRPGEYSFPAGASIEQVMAIIASGKAVTYKITIPEGWTSQMAMARVNENEVLVGDPVAAVPPEGSIRPDTYVFRRGMTRQKLVDDMQAAQTKLVAELWEEKPEGFPLKTREELLTLASIVEKETGVAEEREVVASVFLNRLKQGMRLQSDPTTIYGLVGGKGKLDRPLTKDDLSSDTPYNTYKVAGLPPGPIANPGKATLEAVLNPANTEYLYFVANGTGGHAFASTLAEHNANVAKWRSVATGGAAVVATEAAPGAAQETETANAVPAVPPDVPAEAASQEQGSKVPGEDDGAAAQPIPPPVTSATPEVTPPAAATEGATEPAPAPVANSSEPAPETPVKPESKPAKPDETPVAAKTVLQPGTVIKLADRLVPIPKPNPKK